ncbi:hypothetical protein C723_0106 [Christiangramia flava JLT2011]|uniref:Uncharacterized protein n=1 Tax=Christiangramia flava JLT2011 TaxID=1229726 RepID=A0A1L7I5L3_9FLAO|nr:hypothetical protein GRFL_1790 [Christiangramia flava JLT2011]OSS40697.1 hypothetical protein C723_0106 [Christiangramia flava JLT2011]
MLRKPAEDFRKVRMPLTASDLACVIRDFKLFLNYIQIDKKPEFSPGFCIF